MQIELPNLQITNIQVCAEMFGGNSLFMHNLIKDSSSSFPDALGTLEISGLRFPGGTITEVHFDVDNPDGPPIGSTMHNDYVGISEFLDFVRERGSTATIVLPTRRMYTSEVSAGTSEPRKLDEAYAEKVLNYVKNLVNLENSGAGALPNAKIQAIEIGNEYWGSGNMTAREYGQLLNYLLPKITQILNDSLGGEQQHPKILVQMGSPWDPQYKDGIYSELSWAQRTEQCNLDIISELTDPNARNAIDGLIEHYYYNGSEFGLSDGSAEKSYINVDWEIWNAAGFGDRDLIITEWGVNQSNASQYGLRAASVMIEQMEHMLQLGVDEAFVWPIQGWKTSLAGAPGEELELRPSGAAFQLMAQNIEGLQLMSIDHDFAGLEVNAFAGKERIVLYVMSRDDSTQSVDFLLPKVGRSVCDIDGTKIGVLEGTEANDPSATAVLTYFDWADWNGAESIHFELKPFEVMQVVLTLSSGLKFRGSDVSDRYSGGDGDDSIFGYGNSDSLVGGKGNDIVIGGGGRDLLGGWGGNDTLRGKSGEDLIYAQQGNDLLIGNSGADLLDGGLDSDVLKGGRGADELRGGSGGDLLMGGSGNDTLLGGEDSDYLEGSFGSDLLIGGEGSDELYGGAGQDILISGLGKDILSGGSGQDKFVFASLAPEGGLVHRIVDFQSGSDLIELDSDFFSGLSVGPLCEGLLEKNMSGQAGSGDVRLILEKDTGILWFDRDGAGEDFDRAMVFLVELDTRLTVEDFFVF